MSVYNEQSRLTRIVQSAHHVPLPGDAEGTILFGEAEHRRVIPGVFFTAVGLINLIIALRVVRDRRRAVAHPPSNAAHT